MRKKGIVFVLLLLALTLTAAVAAAECEHAHSHWEYDQTTHWPVCDDCGETIFTAPHNHSCRDDTDPNVCSDCGAVGVEISGISHSWADENGEKFEYNETEHWQVCVACGEELWRGPHRGSCKAPDGGVCSDCGATNVKLDGLVHENQRMDHDATKHWYVCDDCGEIIWSDEHRVPCTDPDSTICSECGAENVQISGVSHGRVTYHSNTTDHWTICLECGQEIERGKHYRWCTDTHADTCSGCQANGVTIADIKHESTSLEHDQDTHWTVCDACGETVEQPEKHFTEAGDPEGVCSVCGVKYTSTPAPTDTPEPSDTPTTPPADMVAVNSVTVSGDLKVGSTLTATIDATGATAYSFWVYDNDNVLIQEAYMTSSNTLTFSASKPGGYVVFVAATNGKLTATGNSGWFIVTGDQVVINSLTVSGTQVVGSPITVTVVSPTATAYSYWLYDGQGVLVDEAYMTASNTYAFTPAKPGIYNVFVAVTDGASGASANTGWFPVQGDPVVINDLTLSGDKKVGSPLTATIDATGATGFSFWVYDYTGALIQEAYMVTTNTYTFTPETAGGYNIFVAVTDGVSGAQANTGWFPVE